MVEALNLSQADRRRRHVTVEVAGLPGSGKTTLAREIIGRREEIASKSLPGSWRKAIAYVRSGAAIWPTLVRVLVAERSVRDCGRMIRLDALRPDRRRGPEVARTTVFDQGPVFLLSRLDPAGRDGDAIGDWRERMVKRWAGALDLVIVLEADDDILFDRVNGRSKQHALKDVPAERGRLALRLHRERLEQVLAELQERGSFDVIRLNTGETPLETTVTLVEEAVVRVSQVG